ncbi:cell wall-binding repeat-containing protein [Frigoribacterium sp. Leaf186]|uniref:cell wall-binding repeat-containing protein n=1 Tax=Frigoribacterium sp. Leaf186 TaxID=1736293 RepID=UPI0006FE465C|nr:cell wall-binding repeat-containing protein [Frigoribacterium sp. Leaf186]KQS16343.1 hypothetical protein ASG05_11265 [Frigoribacterium sp. Leaf186]
MPRLLAPWALRLTLALVLAVCAATTPVPGAPAASAADGSVPTATGTASGAGGGTVTGRIVTTAVPSDDAVAWVYLSAVNGEGTSLGVATTKADGLRFAFSGVVPGRYQVELYDGGKITAHTAFGGGIASGSVPPLRSEDPSSQITVAPGQSVTVSPRSELQPCLTGTVHGRATDGTIHATDGVAVQVVPGEPAKIDPQAQPGLSAVTFASLDGAYRICVPTGSYRLRFVPQPSDRLGNAVPGEKGPDYASAWAGNVQWPEDSPELTLDSAVGPDAIDTVLEAGASIAGTVSFATDDPTGREDGQYAAFAFRPMTGQWEKVRWSRSFGNLDPVSTLLPDTYRMRWTPNADPSASHRPTWAPSTVDVGSATSFPVTAGQKLTGADIVAVPRVLTVSRIDGDDRFATAAEAAAAFPSRTEDPDGRHVAFVASGTNFPDALSAGPAASALGAPLLLVQRDALPSATASELRRLSPERIVVVGGQASVSSDVARALGAIAPVTRLSGDDRYATSRAIMRSVFVDAASPLFAGSATGAYVASGTRFPDALSAGSAAAHLGAPLLIVDGGAAHADAATVAMTRGLDGVVGVGGPASLNPAVLDDLNADSYQFAGADRYDTSVQVNADAFERSDTAFLAVGTNFPDALSGVALAGALDAPLFITPGDCVPAATLDEFDRLDVADVQLLGGPAVLSENVAALTPCG